MPHTARILALPSTKPPLTPSKKENKIFKKNSSELHEDAQAHGVVTPANLKRHGKGFRSVPDSLARAPQLASREERAPRQQAKKTENEGEFSFQKMRKKTRHIRDFSPIFAIFENKNNYISHI
jgi:hypothetical protein